MSHKVYSKVDPSVLLLSITRGKDIHHEREDISPETEPLQVSCKKIKKGANFKPHKHNVLERHTTLTQESWVFIKGRVEASFYDINDEIILVTELEAGDCAVVFRAGHSFKVLEDDTILYEFKNGPYYGVEADKQFI